MCFTLFPVSRNLIFAPLSKRNISRTFNFRAVKFAKKIVVSCNHLFAQRLCAKIRCARTFSELRYLLNHQVKYVSTERFCQDPVENYFGRRRSMGRRRDNPNLRTFVYIPR